MPEIRAQQGTELIFNEQTDTIFVRRKNIGGFMSLDAPQTVEIDAVDTPKKINGSTSAPQLFNFDSPEPGRLRYIGDDPIVTNCAASVTLTTAGNNKVCNIYFAKNGQVVSASRMELRTGIGADERSATALFLCEFEKNDYMEIFVENATDAANITINSMIVVSRG